MECGHSFIKQRKQSASFADFVGFHSLVVGKSNQQGLAEDEGICRTTLWSRFLPFFRYTISSSEINALFPVKKAGGTWVLGLDGMWLHRFGVVMIYRDVANQTNLWWSWQKSESYQNLSEDFYQLYLLTQRRFPSGAISDWKGAIVALVAVFFPDIPHQRCLAHLVREGKKLLPLGSPFFFTLELRRIFQEIIFISDPSAYYDWSQKLEGWQKDYGYLLKVRSTSSETEKKWWYTHGNLRRAIRLLTKNQECLFLYLHYNFLPKTNNSLEGINSQMKRRLGDHRGMPPQQQIVFCFWALAFSRIKTRAELKKLWVYLKVRL